MWIQKNNAPRWLIFSIDIGICVVSLTLAYLLRFNFSIPDDEIQRFVSVFPVVIVIRAVSFFFAKTYSGIIRYTGTDDAKKIFLTITAGSAVLALLNVIRYYFFDQTFILPISVLIIDYLATVFFMISLRITVKVLYAELYNPSREKSHVIIFGAGESGVITKRTLDRDAGTKYKVIAFVDDNEKKENKEIEGVKIYAFDKLEDILNENEVAHVIISVQNVKPERKQEIIEKCLAHNVRVLNVPPVTHWINGELSFKQIKKINIEDLLEREPIKLDEKNVSRQLRGKVALVTGAAGSIGSELVRQISKFSPGKIILVDQAESPLYEMEFELNLEYKKSNYEIVIGDIRHEDRMENLFRAFRPEIVFHAAAYKHVPLMEENPSEAIRNNVLGTKIMADLSVKYGVKKFVMISTDKAVNPTSVMGASKRIAEIYIQSIGKTCDTSFITTRFGNVLGSNGSVIPIFKKQIESGGPVTVTHPDVTRYFMTISEACQLVLEAGAMGKGGEIFIFDMGKSVKIADLAKKMIKLSRLELGKDIVIKFSGLRPGEKLYEELLNDKENTIATHHPRIMVAKVREYDFATISKEIQELILLYETQDNEAIVKKLKAIIPEYISQNSAFEKLDA